MGFLYLLIVPTDLCYAVSMTDEITEVIDELTKHFDLVMDQIRKDIIDVVEKLKASNQKSRRKTLNQ